ncbi:sterol 26-hydroxylase, mitochondrial-like [Hemiscyllium ocellatum]|uniref:sterol 26-hydroxylase, mitochondrial-like n=1 Tax=Hemiscyllium ocellatum TaxID=170820 RepID=UPI0029668BC5|nr:sterol 26-hydroxylase, mitochondrial-like [Hemiscyllium ocellatum]
MFPAMRSLLPRRLSVRRDWIGVPSWRFTPFGRSDVKHSSNIPASTESAALGYKPVHALPGTSGWSIPYWMFIKGYFHKLHQLQLIEHNKFGPMWRTGAFVNVADNNLIEQVLRQDEKYPERVVGSLWAEQRKVQGMANGIITAEGEEWYRLRTLLNERMLKPQGALLYQGVINEVLTDFIDRIQRLRLASESGVTVRNITTELQKYTFEAIAAILLEIRMGCLQEKIPEETQKFITAVATMLRSLVYCEYLPKWTRNWLPFWKQYLQAWDDMFAFARKAVDKKMVQIRELMDAGHSVEGHYLTHLLTSEMNQSEIYSSITELLLGGVDTTANTLTWALYCLAKNPEVQERVFREIWSGCPGEQVPTAQDFSKMPLLRAVIKETLRLYPVVPNMVRTLHRDIVLGGYHIPQKTTFILCHYAMSYSEQNFPDPHHFKPERWLRGADSHKHHPFSSLPFGFGVRGCIGRRVAELEMQLTLARLLKRFQLKLEPGTKEIPAKSRIVLVPENPINLQLLDRL